jgi:myxalamid-type polyketide synthase MxaB
VKEALATEDESQHPLLGSALFPAVLKPGDLLFERTLRGNDPGYFKDHRTFNRVLLPGSALIETALAFATSQLDARCVAVENITFERSVTLPDDGPPVRLQMHATPSRSGHRWEILSASGSNSSWTRHASGTVQRASDLPLLAADDSASVEAVDPAELYAGFERNNLHYGPEFRLIRRLWRAADAIRAEVQLTPSLIRDADRYQLHPALLDACLHASALLFLKDEPGERVHLPVAFERIVFNNTRKPHTQLICTARLRSRSPLLVDLHVQSLNGEPVARIEGMQVQEVDAKSLSDREPWREWMYEPVWEPQQAATVSAGARQEEHWLILSDAEEFSAKLGTFLRDTGAEVTLANSIPLPVPEVTAVVYAFGAVQAASSCAGLLTLVQQLGERAIFPRLYVVTKGAVAAGPKHPISGLTQSPLWGMARVVGMEYPAASCVCVDLDPLSATGDDPAALAPDLLSAPSEDQIAYRYGMRYVARLERYQATPARPAVQRREPGPGEIEVELKAAGLNFRDVLTSLGLYPGNPGPMGLEGAGRVTAVGPKTGEFAIGDRVMVICPGCFDRYLTFDHRLAVRTPAQLTDVEAASIPSVFVTAWHCLSQLAKIKPGDRVLIHTAAGGIGQAAIAIAHLAGAQVYATAHPSKWTVLRSLGVQYIYNSRSTDFGREILSDTAGRGVDIVLNTLTGPGFIEHSLAALGKEGCFLEISKRDVWSAAQMAVARLDVRYHVVDQAEILVREPELVQMQLRTLAELFATGTLQPIPQTVFAMRDRVSAFRMMEQARHVGKIVLVHEQTRTATLDPQATYLITGGSGGLGLVTARALIERGSRRLLLVSRRPPTPEAEARIEQLRAMGAVVLTEAADAADGPRMEALLAAIPPQHPLKGVIHAAGFLDDGLLINQNQERFARVMAPKVEGAWQLHGLTQSLPLDFFILFSSVSSLIGHVGQANYAAANAFLDSLAHHRQSLGLPALAIDWGVWAEIGSAAQFVPQLASIGFDAIRPHQGPAIIAELLAAGQAQIAVAGINWTRFDARRPFFSRVRQKGNPARRDEWDSEELPPALAKDRTALTSYIQRQVASILRYTKPDSVPVQQGFRELGMDSLTSMELRNRLQNALDRQLPAAVIFNYPSVDALTSYLLQSPPATVAETPASTGKPQFEMRERMIVANGQELCLCEWGPANGKPVLCLHGTRDHGANWDPIAQAVAAEGYRVIAPDLRGHGRSSHGPAGAPYHLRDFVSDLGRIAEQLDQPPAVLAGHSLGAIVAALYASAYPKAVQNLLLIEPPLSPVADDSQTFAAQLAIFAKANAEIRQHTAMQNVQTAAERLQQVAPQLAESSALLFAHRLTQPAGAGVIWRWDARLDGQAQLDALFAGLRRTEYLALLGGLTPPPRIVFGEGSGWISRAERAVIENACPAARISLLPGGHNVHTDSPAALAEILLEFAGATR